MARARDAALARTKFVESLIDAAQAAAEARDKVATATRLADRADAEHAAAYHDALAAGWTAAELKASGLSAPATPAKKKPATRKNTTGKTSRTPAARRPTDTEPGRSLPQPGTDQAAGVASVDDSGTGHTDLPPDAQ
jgi:hypothetical protein